MLNPPVYRYVIHDHPRLQSMPIFLGVLRFLIRPQVDGEVVSSIGPGLLCYIGLGKDDSEEDAAYM